MMGKTTSGESYDRCSYCGNWHTYSMQMCRDMVTNKGKLLEIDHLTAENKGLKEYSESRDESIKVYREEIKELKERLKGIISAYDEYIDLLIKEINEMVPLSYTHGWRGTSYEEGRKLREKIMAIKKACEVKE